MFQCALSQCGHLIPCSDAKQCKEPCWSCLSWKKEEVRYGEVTSPDPGTERLGHIPAPHTQTHMSLYLQQGRFCQGWLIDAKLGTGAAAIPLLCCQLVVAVFVCLLSPAGWERSTSQQCGSAVLLSPFIPFLLFHRFVAVPLSNRKISNCS